MIKFIVFIATTVTILSCTTNQTIQSSEPKGCGDFLKELGKKLPLAFGL